MTIEDKNVGLAKSNRVSRYAVSSLFFAQGLCFSSWAARIPTFQQTFGLDEGEVGAVLLAIPVGLMASLPFSGWLTTKYGSRKVTLISSAIYALALLNIASASSILHLVLGLFVFGFAANMVNISVNTQAVLVEEKYKKSIMASFHGVWSLAGFTGATIGTLMIGREIIPFYHFLTIVSVVFMIIAISSAYVIKDEHRANASQPLFVKPDKSILMFGIIAFCALICEGAMFDWSGIYFREVVKVEKEWVGAGYTAFMSTMATGRFISDWFTSRFSVKITLQVSGALIASGLLISVLFPSIIPAIIGFLLVGFGVSSVVPLIYGAAGKSKTMAPGVALAAVSTIGFLGFLVGPPVIGFVAAVSSLQASFSIIAVMGLLVSILSSRLQ